MRNDNVERDYLLLLKMTTPQPEHAKILEALQKASQNSAKAVFFERTGAAFLYRSALVPKQIASRLEGAILNGDTYMIVEIDSSNWMTHGLGVAATWLHARHPS